MSHPLSFYAFFLYTTSSTYFCILYRIKAIFWDKFAFLQSPCTELGQIIWMPAPVPLLFAMRYFFPHMEDYVIQLIYLVGMMIHSVDLFIV